MYMYIKFYSYKTWMARRYTRERKLLSCCMLAYQFSNPPATDMYFLILCMYKSDEESITENTPSIPPPQTFFSFSYKNKQESKREQEREREREQERERETEK